MIDQEHLRAEIVSLLRAIVPDLEGKPLYVVPAGDLPPGVLPESAGGLFKPDLDLCLQTWLDERDEWRGRGAAFIVEGYSRGEIIAVALHEMGHALCFPVTSSEPDDYLEAEAARVEATDIARLHAEQEETISTSGLPLWLQHDSQFHRAVLHLHRRAKLQGYEVPLESIISDIYELSPPAAYRDALAKELDTTPASMPFAELMAKQPPRLFRQLWGRDVFFWLSRQSNPSKAVKFFCQAELSQVIGKE